MSASAKGTLLRMEAAGLQKLVHPKPQSLWIEALSHLDPKYGGLSSVVPQMASQLVLAEQVPVEIAAFCAPGEQRASPGYPEITVSHWPIRPLTWLRQDDLKEDWQRLLRSSSGVHIHGLWETSMRVAAATARRLKKPYIVSAHGMLEPWALRNKALKKKVYSALVERANLQAATCLHALTVAEAEDYRRFGAERPIAIIPNGVSAPESAEPELFQTNFPQTRNRRVLLFLGRLHFKKGLDLLVPAWAALAKRFPEALLVLAGPDAENTLAAIRDMVENHGIADRVVFTGMLSGPMKWSALAAAECFLLPSYSEGLSMATLEAMSLGVPVMITRNCHLPEAACAGAGWEIDPEASSLRAAMEDLLESTPERNAQRGECGRSLVKERFTWERVGRQMAELYRWVTDGVRPQTFELREGA